MNQRYVSDYEDLEFDSPQWKVELGQEFKERIFEYVSQIRKWQPRVHLVSKRDIERLVERHVRESIALSIIPEIRNSRSIMDVGAGAGFPSIPLHLLHNFKNISVVESNRKKALFLKAMKDVLSLENYSVYNERVESMIGDNAQKVKQYQTIIMRAVGNLLPNLKILMRMIDVSSGKGQILIPRGRMALERPREILPNLFMSSYYVSLGKTMESQVEHRKGMEVLVFTKKA